MIAQNSLNRVIQLLAYAQVAILSRLFHKTSLRIGLQLFWKYSVRLFDVARISNLHVSMFPVM